MAENPHELAPADLARSQLSALMDEELAAAEMKLALRRLGKDADWQQRWERYHLVRNALQGQLPTALDLQFAARLQRRIALEQELELVALTSAQPTPRTYWPVRRWALAASLLLAVTIGLIVTAPHLDPSPQAATPHPASTPQIAQQYAQTAFASADSGAAARLNDYLVNHNNYASGSSVNGMLPYVRMVGYQTER